MKTSALLSLLGLLVALSATAGPGHDHDHDHDAPAATAPAALPRFAASSELFELVGVLDGKTLTLYLDRAATNEPLTQAALELELGGEVIVERLGQRLLDGAVGERRAGGKGLHEGGEIGGEAGIVEDLVDQSHALALLRAHAVGR